MCPKIVRKGLILSTINQYGPVATCLNIFNERKLVLELLNVVKVKVKIKVKVRMKKFRNCFLLPELIDCL